MISAGTKPQHPCGTPCKGTQWPPGVKGKAASGWELSLKQALGRLELGGSAEVVVPDLMLRSDVGAF